MDPAAKDAGSNPQPAPPRKSLLNASAAGAAFLVLVQLLSRLLTFVMNQLLIRYLSPTILGEAAQLELYMMTILFFSRESLRMALQRQAEVSPEQDADNNKKKDDKIVEGTVRGQAQTVVNLSYLAVPAGFVFVTGLWLIQSAYSRVSDVDASTKKADSGYGGYFNLALGIYALASLLELLSEPGFAVAQQRLLYSLRAACESSAVISNCVVTLGITVFAAKYMDLGDGGLGSLPFAIGQVVFALCLVLGYPLRLWKVADKDGFSLLPKQIYSRCVHSRTTETGSGIHRFVNLLVSGQGKATIFICQPYRLRAQCGPNRSSSTS